MSLNGRLSGILCSVLKAEHVCVCVCVCMGVKEQRACIIVCVCIFCVQCTVYVCDMCLRVRCIAIHT